MMCPNPKCGAYIHRVDDTDGKQKAFTMRRCFCPTCGAQFSTVEYPLGVEISKELYEKYCRPSIAAIDAGKRAV